MLSFKVAKSESALAEPLIADTEKRFKPGISPIWVSDGLDAYGAALRNRHCTLKIYPLTGKRGRPRKPKLVASPGLRYGQVVKTRDERHRVTGIAKRSVYGRVPLDMIDTVYVERHFLSMRQENRRLTRKTIAFSKDVARLIAQETVYEAYFDFVRPHRGLQIRVPKQANDLQKYQKRTPAVAAGITDHIWSLEELMTKNLVDNY